MTEEILAGRQRPLLLGSVGVRVASAVNLLVLVAGVGFLAFDYRREGRQRLADKQAALNEQATTVLQAVSGLRQLSDSDRQGFLDGVSRGMDEDNSSGRHLVVEIDGRIVQSQAYHHDSEDVLGAIRSGTLLGTTNTPVELSAHTREQVRRIIIR